MIRKATLHDIPAITSLGIEALLQDPYEELVISREKVRSKAIECVSSACNFAWVAEKNGVVGGAVLALVHDFMCYERKQATVIQFYCKIPGEGIKLLRELKRWSHSRPIIKMIVFTLERKVDPRVPLLLKRIGMQEALPIFLEVL